MVVLSRAFLREHFLFFTFLYYHTARTLSTSRTSPRSPSRSLWRENPAEWRKRAHNNSPRNWVSSKRVPNLSNCCKKRLHWNDFISFLVFAFPGFGAMSEDQTSFELVHFRLNRANRNCFVSFLVFAVLGLGERGFWTQSCLPKPLVLKARCQVVSPSRLIGADALFGPCVVHVASRFQWHGTSFVTTQWAVCAVAMKVTDRACDGVAALPLRARRKTRSNRTRNGHRPKNRASNDARARLRKPGGVTKSDLIALT